jgi:hypothetical protein
MKCYFGYAAVLWLGMLTSFSVSSAEAQAQIQRFDISARVKVTASGAVEDVQVRGEFDPRIVAHLNRAVRELKIKPAQRNGQPVAAETTMKFDGTLERRPGQSGTTISSRYTGHGPEFEKLVKPQFPTLGMTSRDRAAEVVLVVDVGSDGRVVDVQTHYVVVPENAGNGARFESAAKAAARKWLFNQERVDDQPVAARVLVPIKFYRTREELLAIEAARRKMYPEIGEAPLDQRPLALTNATGLGVLN